MPDKTSDAKGRMSVHFSSASNEWSTPQDFFDKMNAEFDFTLDVCATEENAKCAAFISPKQDGLATEWRGRCWMNPPYGREIGKWVQRAYLQSHQMRNGILEPAELVVCLVPARTDTAWWHEWALKADEIRYLRGRLKFQGHQNSAPFPSAVLIFRSPVPQ